MTNQQEAIIEADVTVSMIERVNALLETAEAMANIDPRDWANMTPDMQAAYERDKEARIQRAAEIIAKYGIDRAMLQHSGRQADDTIDQVFLAQRPFAEQMNDLFAACAAQMGAKIAWIKSWNPKSGPKARGGIPRGGYDYGYRVFAWESDMLRIELLYTSLRNQALAQVKQIVDEDTKFGQRQKAMRQEYLRGWVAGVRSQIAQAEREAAEKAEAEAQEARDRWMESGQGVKPEGPGVALVLADRKQALSRAYDAARGITPEHRARWAEDSEKYAKEARERQEKRDAEIAACDRCKKAKSGFCNTHRIRVGRRFTYRNERVGEAAGMWSKGHAAGRQADLGSRTSVGGSRTGIEG